MPVCIKLSLGTAHSSWVDTNSCGLLLFCHYVSAMCELIALSRYKLQQPDPCERLQVQVPPDIISWSHGMILFSVRSRRVGHIWAMTMALIQVGGYLQVLLGKLYPQFRIHDGISQHSPDLFSCHITNYNVWGNDVIPVGYLNRGYSTMPQEDGVCHLQSVPAVVANAPGETLYQPAASWVAFDVVGLFI